MSRVLVAMLSAVAFLPQGTSAKEECAFGVDTNEDDGDDQSTSSKILILGVAISLTSFTAAIAMLLMLCNMWICYAVIKLRRQKKVAQYAVAKMADSDLELSALEENVPINQ